MGQSPALMIWRSEFIPEPQSHHEWIDVHISIHCCAKRRGEIHSHIRIYPDLLDVCVDSPATWLAIKIVIYARLKRELRFFPVNNPSPNTLTPEEIALSVLADIVHERRLGSLPEAPRIEDVLEEISGEAPSLS